MKFPKFRFPTLKSWKQPWWIKVETLIPACTYYFGPFDSEQEAKLLQLGYIEDLVREGAQDIAVDIKRVQPKQLTVYECE